jgi:hypothetical protein
LKNIEFNWRVNASEVIILALLFAWVLIYFSGEIVGEWVASFDYFNHYSPGNLRDLVKALLNLAITTIAVREMMKQRKYFFKEKSGRGEGLNDMQTLFMPFALAALPLISSINDIAIIFGSPLVGYLIILSIFLCFAINEWRYLFKFEEKKDVFFVSNLHAILVIALLISIVVILSKL